MRFSDVSVGKRLGASYFLLTALIVVAAGVGWWGCASRATASSGWPRSSRCATTSSRPSTTPRTSPAGRAWWSRTPVRSVTRTRPVPRATESLSEAVAAIAGHAGSLSSAAAELTEVSARVAQSSGHVDDQAAAVARAAEDVSGNVRTMAVGSREMSAAIDDRP